MPDQLNRSYKEYMTKRIWYYFGILLALSMCVLLFSGNVHAASDPCDEPNQAIQFYGLVLSEASDSYNNLWAMVEHDLTTGHITVGDELWTWWMEDLSELRDTINNAISEIEDWTTAKRIYGCPM